MKKIGVFDLDGTVYTHTLTFSVVEELLESPDFEEQNLLVKEARKVWKERASTEAYWSYNETILAVLEKILPQTTPQQLGIAVERVLHLRGNYCYVYTTNLIRTLKEDARTLIAISGSIKDIVEPFARAHGFDIIISSELEMVSGAYTGKRVSQTNKDKHALLKDIVSAHGLTLDDSIGIGDTHRDISVLEVVENPIAFNPNAALYDEAVMRGWKIVIERKNMIYELSKGATGYNVASIHPSHTNPHAEKLR